MRIAICDDDLAFISILAKKLKTMFSQIGQNVELFRFSEAQELLDIVNSSSHPFDIYFLDIEMPGIRGTTLAKELRQRNPSYKIVFITSYDDEVFNAFHYRADAFIPKSLLDERLELELTRLIDAMRQEQVTESIAFEVEVPESSRHADLDLFLRLHPWDILYFESNNRKVLLHAIDGTYTLKRVNYLKIRDEYLKRDFVESHRCFLVNVAHIKAVGKRDVLLDNGENINLSRRHYNNIVVRYMNYMRR